MKDWIVSQYGAREKYAIPRALAQQQQLKLMYTDLWVRPGSLTAALHSGGKSRFNSDLAQAPVHDFNQRFLLRKALVRILKNGEQLDEVYDQSVSAAINSLPPGDSNFFGYSYSSRLSMKAAKAKGFRTILGQINPGPAEANIVAEEFRKYRDGKFKPTIPGEAYWELWRQEIAFADVIVVNSEWSKKLLVSAGVDAGKCVVIPLAYEQKIVARQRVFKKQFETAKPLKLLYLGGVGIRKGFHILVEAMKLLKNEPVILDVVGELKGPDELLSGLPQNIMYRGSVSPDSVADFYQHADVFVFPTLSDGFGLTQLEAQAYKLPVITTEFCAPVITDRLNGLVVKEITPRTIYDAVMSILSEPDRLPVFSEHSVDLADYSISQLSNNLNALG